MIRMEESESLRPPWTPNSGMKLFGIHTEQVTLDQLLDHTQSPMRLVDKQFAPQVQDNDDFRSPSRPSKRHKAPPSPATAMLLHAARAIENNGNPGPGTDSASPGNPLFGSSPAYHQHLNPLSPVSPARTPSRLLFSPRSEPRVMASTGIGASPSNGMITSYNGMLSTENNPGQEVIGSIWKQSVTDRQKSAKSTARRPLLQQTPTIKAHGNTKHSNINNVHSTPTNPNTNDANRHHHHQRDVSSPLVRSCGNTPTNHANPINKNLDKDEPVPLPVRTPTYKIKTPKMKLSSEQRKDRKTYSTAGRPRVRGEYKCGKCGFYPKKARHDCEEEKQRQDAAAAAGGNKMRAGSGTPPTSRMDLPGMSSHGSPPTPMIAPMKLELGNSPVIGHKDMAPMMDSHDMLGTSPTHSDHSIPNDNHSVPNNHSVSVSIMSNHSIPNNNNRPPSSNNSRLISNGNSNANPSVANNNYSSSMSINNNPSIANNINNSSLTNNNNNPPLATKNYSPMTNNINPSLVNNNNSSVSGNKNPSIVNNNNPSMVNNNNPSMSNKNTNSSMVNNNNSSISNNASISNNKNPSMVNNNNSNRPVPINNRPMLNMTHSVSKNSTTTTNRPLSSTPNIPRTNSAPVVQPKQPPQLIPLDA